MIAALVVVALIGGSLGSFAGVVAERGWRGAMRGRSQCTGCRRTLSWFELVPLFSYVALRGRCRTCAVAIGPRALAWECAGAVPVTALFVAALLALT